GLTAPGGAHRPEHLLENIGETAGKSAAEAEIAGTAAAVLKGGMAEAVVGGTLLIVLQDVVGFVQVLELLLGRLVTRIAVRVILHRELAVGALQLLGISRFGDTEDFVKVLFRHGRFRPGSLISREGSTPVLPAGVSPCRRSIASKGARLSA